MLACHAGDRGFESRPDRHFIVLKSGSVAQSVEQWLEEPRVGSSILPGATILLKFIFFEVIFFKKIFIIFFIFSFLDIYFIS